MYSILIHKWHRRIGVVSALFVILLSVTGLLLNHTEQMGLDEHYIKSKHLLDWYDIRPGSAPDAFRLENIWVTRIGERLYFNEKELDEQSKVLWGIARQDGIIILALDDTLLLLTEEGAQVEKLNGYDGVPAGMTAIGTNEYAELIIRAAHGDYLVDLNALAWEDYEELAADWSIQAQLPNALNEQLLQQYRGKGLSWERFILDMHSGRLIGGIGIYIVDMAAVLFVILALSGVWMWLRRK